MLYSFLPLKDSFFMKMSMNTAKKQVRTINLGVMPPLSVLYPKFCRIVHLVIHQILYILKAYFWQSTKLAATLWWIVECIVCFEIELSHDGEIVGLHIFSNGRACEQHVSSMWAACEQHVSSMSAMKGLLGWVIYWDWSWVLCSFKTAALRPLSRPPSSRMALRHAELALSHDMWLQVRGKEGCWLGNSPRS